MLLKLFRDLLRIIAKPARYRLNWSHFPKNCNSSWLTLCRKFNVVRRGNIFVLL